MHGTLQAAKRYRQFMRRAALYTAGGTLMGLAIFGLYRWVLHDMTRQALIRRPLYKCICRGVSRKPSNLSGRCAYAGPTEQALPQEKPSVERSTVGPEISACTSSIRKPRVHASANLVQSIGRLMPV